MDLLNQSSETLAGRIAYLELTPFTAREVAGSGADAIDRLWVRGGFPDSYLAETENVSFAWRQEFIRTYLERDVPLLGPRIPAETLYRFWQMLANNQGQLLNAARVAAGLGVSGQTVARYLDVMVDLLLVRRLPPWTANPAKRLIRSPKVYVRDSGIVHALLGIREREQLLGHPVVGPSWEGWVIENLLQAFTGATAWFYRSAAGAEVDLLVEPAPKERWAIEIKRSRANPQPGKGFYIASDDVKATRRMVVYPGEERYRLDAATEGIPFAAIADGKL
jgi:predicted AAA+ superfamily ATPase